MLHSRHYTADQANALLPEVRSTVRRLQDAKRVLQDEGFDTGFATLADVVGGAFPGRVRAQAAVAATLGFEHLEELDLLVRDLEAGLIDFPALRDGREVYLCWQVDEHEVGHWHAAGDRLPEPPPAGPLAVAASYQFSVSSQTMRLCASWWWTTSPRCATRSIARCGWTATRVQLAADGREALDALAAPPPDAIVLDVLMPEPDGLEVCRRLRAAGDRTPVLMLTARDAVPDRVEGLDAGADDYLVKPFALEELGARLRALLRRTRRPDVEEPLRYADLELDPAGHTVAPRRAPDRADPHRVPAARAAAAPPAPGAHPHADLRARVGLRLRPELELARGLRRLPAPQARASRG